MGDGRRASGDLGRVQSAIRPAEVIGFGSVRNDVFVGKRSERERTERDMRERAWQEKVERSERARGRLESKLGAT